MIIIMKEKDFLKNAKKLVEPKDYLVVDGTDEDGGPLNRYTQMLAMPGLNPPTKCLKGKDALDDERDIEEKEERWLGSKDLFKSIATMLFTMNQYNGSFNIFVCLSKKAYNKYGEKICSIINKRAGFKICRLYDDVGKKWLEKDINPDKMKILDEVVKKMKKKIKKLTPDYAEAD